MGSLVLYLILKKVLLRNEILFKTEESMIYVNDDFHAIILILFFVSRPTIPFRGPNCYTVSVTVLCLISEEES